MTRLWILAVFAVFSEAQEFSNLTPEQAVERALQSHPLLTSGQARVEAAEGSRQQSSLGPNPRLFLQSENTRLGTTATPFRYAQETDNFAYASQILEAPGKRQSRVDLSTELIHRREAELDLIRTRIANSVAAAYWSAVGGERTRDVLKQSLDNFEQIVQYHRDRVREGAIAESDLIRIELEREQIAIQLQNAEQEARKLRLQLFREMGEPEQRQTVLTGNLSEVRPFVTVPPDEAIAQRRDLKLSRQLIEQARAATRLEQSNARPDPEVLFGYKRTAGFNTLIAGLQLPMPFRNRNQGAIAASLAEAKAVESDLRAAELSAKTEIAAAESEYQQKMRLVTETLPRIRSQADDTVRIARAVYREGASDILRLLDAERAGLQTQLLLVRSLADYQLALVHLKAATGMMP